MATFLRPNTLAVALLLGGVSTGAAFADSLLMKRDHYFAAGIDIAWILGESARKVEVAE